MTSAPFKKRQARSQALDDTLGIPPDGALFVGDTDAPAGVTWQSREPVSFTPSFVATGDPAVYEMPSVPNFASPFYGPAPNGLYVDDGFTVEVWARIVTGSNFDDELTFDPGSGYYAFPLPVPPLPIATGAVGTGQIVLSDQPGGVGNLHTCTAELDPGLDYGLGLVATPGDVANVAWLFLDGSHDPQVAGMLVGAANPGVPDTMMFFTYHIRYLKA